MISDKDYNKLSDFVYHVDSKKDGRIILSINSTLLNENFQVLEVEDNHSNGMQAMAMVPLVS